jgi:hypothetical protein
LERSGKKEVRFTITDEAKGFILDDQPSITVTIEKYERFV